MLKYFQLFFNDNFDASLIIKLEGGEIIDCNNKAIELFGFESKEKVIGNNWWDLGAAELPDAMYQNVKDQLKEQKKWTHIFNIFPNYSTFPLKVRVNVSLFSWENVDYCLVRAENITHTILLEKQLKVSSNRVEKLISAVPDIFFVIDKNGVYKDVYYSETELVFNPTIPIKGNHISKRKFPKKIENLVLLKISEALEFQKTIVTYYKLKLEHKTVDFEARFIALNTTEVLLIVRDVTSYNQAQKDLKDLNKNYKELVSNSPYGIAIHKNGKIIFSNNRCVEILKVENEAFLIGKSMFDMVVSGYKKQSQEIIQKIKNGEEMPFRQLKIINFQDEVRIIEAKSVLINFQNEKVIQTVFKDVTELKNFEKQKLRAEIAESANILLEKEVTKRKLVEKEIEEQNQKINSSLREKEVLLKEVHHRVKNNLQVISSILNLQSSYVKDTNTLNILRESQNRIKSMSFIHESLYQNTNFTSIDFASYIENISSNLVQTYAVGKEIHLETKLEPIHISLDQAIPCGLMLNEIVTNALKYAFIGRDNGNLKITLTEDNNVVEISISDNGIGMPPNFDVEDSDSLGLQLVYTLIEQLEGTIENTIKGGTNYLIKFVKESQP